MTLSIKQTWVFSIQDFYSLQCANVGPLFSGEMLVAGEEVQKFKLEFFATEGANVIHFRVRRLSGILYLHMKVSIMEGETKFRSNGWVTVKVSSGPFALMAGEDPLNDSSEPFILMTCNDFRILSSRSHDKNAPAKFCCEVDIPIGHQMVKEPQLEHRMKGRAHLVHDLAKAISKGAQFSDVTLTCQDRSFASNKLILAARSDVFAAMFSHEGMAKASNDLVGITDMEPSTLEEMLNFIYTDQFGGEVSFESTCKLLVAAKKYKILPLTAVCEHLISSKVNIDTAMPALTTAYLCGSEILKSFLLDFAKDNMSNLYQTSEWQKMIEAKHGVYLEIIQDLLWRRYVKFKNSDTIDTKVKVEN